MRINVGGIGRNGGPSLENFMTAGGVALAGAIGAQAISNFTGGAVSARGFEVDGVRTSFSGRAARGWGGGSHHGAPAAPSFLGGLFNSGETNDLQSAVNALEIARNNPQFAPQAIAQMRQALGNLDGRDGQQDGRIIITSNRTVNLGRGAMVIPAGEYDANQLAQGLAQRMGVNLGAGATPQQPAPAPGQAPQQPAAGAAPQPAQGTPASGQRPTPAAGAAQGGAAAGGTPPRPAPDPNAPARNYGADPERMPQLRQNQVQDVQRMLAASRYGADMAVTTGPRQHAADDSKWGARSQGALDQAVAALNAARAAESPPKPAINTRELNFSNPNDPNIQALRQHLEANPRAQNREAPAAGAERTAPPSERPAAVPPAERPAGNAELPVVPFERASAGLQASQLAQREELITRRRTEIDALTQGMAGLTEEQRATVRPHTQRLAEAIRQEGARQEEGHALERSREAVEAMPQGDARTRMEAQLALREGSLNGRRATEGPRLDQALQAAREGIAQASQPQRRTEVEAPSVEAQAGAHRDLTFITPEGRTETFRFAVGPNGQVAESSSRRVEPDGTTTTVRTFRNSESSIEMRAEAAQAPAPVAAPAVVPAPEAAARIEQPAPVLAHVPPPVVAGAASGAVATPPVVAAPPAPVAASTVQAPPSVAAIPAPVAAPATEVVAAVPAPPAAPPTVAFVPPAPAAVTALGGFPPRMVESASVAPPAPPAIQRDTAAIPRGDEGVGNLAAPRTPMAAVPQQRGAGVGA